MEEINVIIPAYNEEDTIGAVIDLVYECDLKCKAIVVDNDSSDNTSKVALEKGATVIECKQKGKGYAMEVGLQNATSDIVVYLDADIIDYHSNIIHLLVDPIIHRDCDLVKSSFEREAGGLVTEIATKPLLEVLFPDMYRYQEPLSGMIAAKKSFLEKITFEKDYGVDIGIVIDAYNLNAKVEEVNIGRFENKSHLKKTKEVMRNMSLEVTKSIVKKYNEIRK